MKYYSIIIIFELLKLSTCSSVWPMFQYWPNLGASPQELSVSGSLHSFQSYLPGNQTVFVVHAWKDGPDATYIVAIRDALLKNTQSNVIIVDWSVGSKGSYFYASLNAIKVTGPSISDLIENNNLDPSLVYCVGYGIGAYSCGIAGKNLDGKMGRITGLDPAGPLFNNGELHYNNRLAKGDAIFVDVIHTDENELATRIAEGDIDFYVQFNNSFSHQKRCAQVGYDWCKHQGACFFFANSTLPTCKFTSHFCTKAVTDGNHNFLMCDSESTTMTTNMGYYAHKSAQNGIYVIQADKRYCDTN